MENNFRNAAERTTALHDGLRAIAEELTYEQLKRIEPYLANDAVPIFQKEGASVDDAIMLAKLLSLGIAFVSDYKLRQEHDPGRN